MRTTQLVIAALCIDWLALSLAKYSGFLIAPWWLIWALPVYTLVIASFAVFACLVLLFVFLVLKSIYLAHKGSRIVHGIS
jgi:hypothetical protein